MHVETETGIINPLKEIGNVVHQIAPDALYIVDSATAFPGNPIDFDKWGIPGFGGKRGWKPRMRSSKRCRGPWPGRIPTLDKACYDAD